MSLNSKKAKSEDGGYTETRIAAEASNAMLQIVSQF